MAQTQGQIGAMEIENHPLDPFLPKHARLLMLGSFPPKRERWSMDFFYPNFQNDMWRIMGLLFYGERNHFVVEGERRFCYDAVVEFCRSKGIAIYDTATTVRRLNDNASDKFLEIITPTDISALLHEMPLCDTIVTTGEKATTVVSELMGCSIPKVGGKETIRWCGKEFNFYRMPSSSRAYPLALEKKADFYRVMFEDLRIF